MRDPELVARAQRAAARLESSWEHWRALHGLAAAPGQPIVSYVGYSLAEPWGEPRVVVGVGADEAEFLADYLDRDDCAVSAQLPVQQALVPEQPQPPESEYTSASLLTAPLSLGASRPHVSGGSDMSAEFAGWSSGELPGQAAEQLASWPVVQPEQPPAGP
ncbi:MAG TPA: hypothetical protein VKU39_14555 [Streptosporangiaceae bacterium]|nr:hypothetical protein [Streptosporangiaceae bacterium]